MLSTYLNFNLIDRDMARSLDRVASDPIVAREAKYYRETIGSVASVDAFLDDYRLYSYAMKAYGLEDMTYARAFMRQVLESDLTDAESFANKLEDERYRTFAAAFAFGGNSQTSVSIDIQSNRQTEDTVGLYDKGVQDEAAGYVREFNYYKDRIGDIESVDALLADRRLTEFALEAAGLDVRYYSLSHLRDILTSDVEDPDSYVNREENARYLYFAGWFNFAADGSVPEGEAAQDEAQIRNITETYIFDVPDRIIPLAAEIKTEYFKSAIADVETIDDFVGDFKLVNYLWTAYGQPASFTMTADVKAALTSDLDDPASFANTHPNGVFRAMASLFNFGTDGTAPDGAQTNEQSDALVARFMETYDDAGERRDANRAAYFRSASESVVSIDGLMRDTQLFDYTMRAYGFDPQTVSKEAVRRALTSDVDDPLSFANRQSDGRYRALAAAFNFDANGLATTARRAQSQAEADALAQSFAERGDLLGLSDKEVEAEIIYYREQTGLIDDVEGFLGDQRLVGFVLDARGIARDEMTEDMLRQVLTSDVNDAESFVNTLPDRQFRLLAASFNFQPDGTVSRELLSVGQARADIVTTEENYLRQSLEEEAGAENEGVRLALYFKRMAGEITNAFDILADPALQEVVRIALGLPQEIAQADIDAQAAMIEERVDFADFTDPEELDKFLTRFSALYDIEYDTTPSLASTLLSTDPGATLNADMLMSLSQVRLRLY
ncbi:DUF1217 domain-containing protein [Pararhizobium haloflavum]|uniref:DUF1217 domain-containing protein n=1 Tax=Pararhizobium haloflavum TaxID=2037914 RepID=UPI0018E48E51|nr:DUF1217 domain-containing protein [Pararhizobium haloflavum]